MVNSHVKNFVSVTSGTDCDPTSTSDADDVDVDKDSEEYRLVRAFVTRRQEQDVEAPPQDSSGSVNGGPSVNGSPSPQAPARTETEEKTEEKKKKRKKGLKRIFFSCLRPRTSDTEPVRASEPVFQFLCDGGSTDDAVKEEDGMEEVVNRLTEIADEVPFTPPDLETDSTDDEVEKVIGLLLRETGDRLNKEMKDADIASLFGNYSFFRALVTAFLTKMGLLSDPNTPGPQASLQTQIAVTCEVTSRLSAVDTLPTNRLLGLGARYLQDHYSSWARQQGGYEEAFYSEGEEDDQ